METELKNKRENAEAMEVASQGLPMLCLLAVILAPEEIKEQVYASSLFFNLVAIVIGLAFLLQGMAEGWCSMLFLKGCDGVSYQAEKSLAKKITIGCMSAMLALVFIVYFASDHLHAAHLFGLIFFAVAFNLGRPFWMVFWMKKKCPEMCDDMEVNDAK